MQRLREAAHPRRVSGVRGRIRSGRVRHRLPSGAPSGANAVVGMRLRGPLEAMRAQLQIAHELGGHEMHQVRAGGHLKAGCKLPRDRRAADLRLRLQHQHRTPPRASVAAHTEAIVSAADDDAVVARWRGLAAPRISASCRRSLSTARAALAPGAPMTPPPGWVLEPHM